jgi:HEAT repeat protein
MSARRQGHLILSALCTMAAYGLGTGSTHAQCHRGGGSHPQMSQGFPMWQMMQQQMLTQQQQQQMLQTAKLERQMLELAKEGPEALKTALKSNNPQMRLIAVLTVGKHGPALPNELIDRLTDDDASVRQAARRGLISLSTMRKGQPNKGRGVDFGPAATANRTAQQTAARRWHTWFERQQKSEETARTVVAKAAARPVAAPKTMPVATVAQVEKSETLTQELLDATPTRSEEVLRKLRDGKGAIYTEALAEAIPQMNGLGRNKAREALAERLTRMTTATLRDMLSDDQAEVRRAAALAVAMKDTNTLIPDLIALLDDPAPAVPPAARAALKSLTNQDFGSVSFSDSAQQQKVVAAWKEWWQKQRGM